MTIKQGDKLPSATLKIMGPDGPREVSVEDFFGGRKVVLFAVPGAFTRTCSAKHLPGFVGHADEILAKGVDAIACVSVNDVFVMDAWGKDQNVGDKVAMLADGSAEFARALGLEADFSERGLGLRSQRYAMIVEDGTVTGLFVEAPGAYEVSAAEAVLANL